MPGLSSFLLLFALKPLPLVPRTTFLPRASRSLFPLIPSLQEYR